MGAYVDDDGFRYSPEEYPELYFGDEAFKPSEIDISGEQTEAETWTFFEDLEGNRF